MYLTIFLMAIVSLDSYSTADFFPHIFMYAILKLVGVISAPLFNYTRINWNGGGGVQANINHFATTRKCKHYKHSYMITEIIIQLYIIIFKLF